MSDWRNSYYAEAAGLADHQRNYRTRTEEACLVGAFTDTRPFKDQYAEAQIRAAIAQIDKGNTNMARVTLCQALKFLEGGE
jgi:hypothetical protein